MQGSDTYVFVLRLYWVNRADMQCKVQMEQWDGSVVDTNATCHDIGQKCLQLPGMRTVYSVIVIQLSTHTCLGLMFKSCCESSRL